MLQMTGGYVHFNDIETASLRTLVAQSLRLVLSDRHRYIYVWVEVRTASECSTDTRKLWVEVHTQVNWWDVRGGEARLSEMTALFLKVRGTQPCSMFSSRQQGSVNSGRHQPRCEGRKRKSGGGSTRWVEALKLNVEANIFDKVTEFALSQHTSIMPSSPCSIRCRDYHSTSCSPG